MRRRSAVAALQAFDEAAYSADIRAGHGSAYRRTLENHGIVWEPSCGPVNLIPSDFVQDAPFSNGRVANDAVFRWAQSQGIAMDAQSETVTMANAGIPAFLTNFIDPRIIDVLVSPMAAVKILGETKKGDWLTTVGTFPNVELAGETAAYGDYSNNGSVSVNANFTQRQAFQYQTWTQWGARELAEAGLAGIDWAARQNAASMLILMKQQNRYYFFGVDNLQTYGLLNDPQLYTPIAPAALWNAAATTAGSIYEDIRRMFVQLQLQCQGTIDMQSRLTLAMSPEIAVALNKTDSFNVNVWLLLKTNFPSLRVEVAVEYATASGQLVQMIVDEIDGVETATCVYTDKMRAHGVETYSTYWRQKKSQGTMGTVIFRYVGISQMLGV